MADFLNLLLGPLSRTVAILSSVARSKIVLALVDECPHTTKATVVACSLAASDQITVDITVTLYRVEARILNHKFSDDVYMVRITKPDGMGDLIDEGGTPMEHGKFFFDSTEEITIDTELEVEITEIGPTTGVS